jgi:hypothetical protein
VPEQALADLARLAEAQDAEGIKQRLAAIVPDYTPYGVAEGSGGKIEP